MKYHFFSFSRRELVGFRLKMKKCGFWFKALSRIDRVLIDLAIEVTDGVHSFRLVEALRSVARKVEDRFESGISYATNAIGFPLARRLSVFAQKWGNSLAREWTNDPLFARFLAILHINSLAAFNQH
jgi:hypothetical protein